MVEAPAATIWLTGLPSAGKTTLAHLIGQEIAKRGRASEILDGDVVRRAISPDLSFTRADREENVRRIGYMAGLLSRHGVIVIVAAVSPYRESRRLMRKQLQPFVEVYVNATLSVCQQRDVKGLYQRAASGKMGFMTGLSDPYEPPDAPEVICPTDSESPEESTFRITTFLVQTRYI